jgi:hypothetical protein
MTTVAGLLSDVVGGLGEERRGSNADMTTVAGLLSDMVGGFWGRSGAARTLT